MFASIKRVKFDARLRYIPFLVARHQPCVGISFYPILFPPFVAVGDRVLPRLVEGDPIRAFLALLSRDRLSLQ